MCDVVGCKFTYRSSAGRNGTITSPNYPGLYPRHPGSPRVSIHVTPGLYPRHPTTRVCIHIIPGLYPRHPTTRVCIHVTPGLCSRHPTTRVCIHVTQLPGSVSTSVSTSPRVCIHVTPDHPGSVSTSPRVCIHVTQLPGSVSTQYSLYVHLGSRSATTRHRHVSSFRRRGPHAAVSNASLINHTSSSQLSRCLVDSNPCLVHV